MQSEKEKKLWKALATINQNVQNNNIVQFATITAGVFAMIFNANAAISWNQNADNPEFIRQNRDHWWISYILPAADREHSELTFEMERNVSWFPVIYSSNDVRTIQVDFDGAAEWCEETHIDGNVLFLPYYDFNRNCRPLVEQDMVYLERHFPQHVKGTITQVIPMDEYRVD